MYDDRKEKFSFKSFFLTILVVLLFIFLMLWLFPTRGYVDRKVNVYDLDRISVLYDEIFANNIARMKDAAVGYYTNERLPQKVGETKKLTLQQMYDLHLVLNMKDKDGKACDVNKSYVEITKYTEEYRLKVNLSCGKQEDYIIVYLGCYNYCPDGICEKKEPTPSDKTKEEQSYSCKVVNGKYYDKNGKVVSKAEYDKSCTTPETYSCKVVNGKYYDKNGKVVSKAEYDKSCTTPETYSCKVVNGKYYDKNGKVVSKAEYDKSCTTPEPVKYMYEYKYVPDPVTTCTDWSEWQKTVINATDTIEVQTKVFNELIGYNKIKKQIGVKRTTTTTQVTEKYISGYTTELVVVDTKKINTGKTTTKTVTKEVKVGTVEKYAGIGSGTTVPKDTSTTHYKNVTANKGDSCSYCENETIYTWEIYKVEDVHDVVTTTEQVPVYKIVNVYEEKPVPIYSYRTVPKQEVKEEKVYDYVDEAVYSDITKYRSRTCTTTLGQPDYKWSLSKNDTDLINKKYKLTGNVKEV